MSIDYATLYDLILPLARAAMPHEACGLLLGHDDVVQTVTLAQNIHPEPLDHYEIDRAAVRWAWRYISGALVGFWHSHPTGPPLCSAADILNVYRLGKIHAIIAPQCQEMRLFTLKNAVLYELAKYRPA